MKTISVFTKSGVTLTFKEDEVFNHVNSPVGIEVELGIDELYQELVNCKQYNQELHVKQTFEHDEVDVVHYVYLPSEQISWFIMEEK